MRGSEIGRFVGLPKEIVVAMLGVAMHRDLRRRHDRDLPRSADAGPDDQVRAAGTIPRATTDRSPATTAPPDHHRALRPSPRRRPPPPPRRPDHLAAPRRGQEGPGSGEGQAEARRPRRGPPGRLGRLGLFVGSQSPADVMALGQQLGVTPSIDTVYADQSSDYCTYSPPTTSMTLMVGIGNCTAAQVAAIGQNLVTPARATPSSASCGSRTRTSRVVPDLEPTQPLRRPVRRDLPEHRHDHAGREPVVQHHVEPQRGNRQRSRRTDVDRHVARQGLRRTSSASTSTTGPGTPANVQAVVAFAHSQGLPVAIPEWGLNGTDDPAFINTMAGLIKDPANDITVESYFSYAGSTDSDITQFPASDGGVQGGLRMTPPGRRAVDLHIEHRRHVDGERYPDGHSVNA